MKGITFKFPAGLEDAKRHQYMLFVLLTEWIGDIFCGKLVFQRLLLSIIGTSLAAYRKKFIVFLVKVFGSANFMADKSNIRIERNLYLPLKSYSPWSHFIFILFFATCQFIL